MLRDVSHPSDFRDSQTLGSKNKFCFIHFYELVLQIYKLSYKLVPLSGLVKLTDFKTLKISLRDNTQS